MAKEKKIELRDIAYEQVASAIMQDQNIDLIRKHKDGLEYKLNGEVFAIRIVKKKEALDPKEFRGEFFFDAKAQAFGYRDKAKVS
jgi:hypothetical protein